jgi:hypothetical protein
LSACNAGETGYAPVSTCASSALCDPVAGRCDVCAAGAGQCNGTVLQACNASQSGWTDVVDCADAGTCSPASDQCVPPPPMDDAEAGPAEAGPDDDSGLDADDAGGD